MAENKYHAGKIYIIKSEQTKKCYVGSTTKIIDNRLSQHKDAYKLYLNGKDTYRASYEIVKYDDAVIEVLENYKCETKAELRRREQDYINIYINCSNRSSACKGNKIDKIIVTT